MVATKIFINPGQVIGDELRVTGKDAEHMKVLRMRSGDEFTACDGERDYLCRVVEFGPNLVCGSVLESLPAKGEPSIFCTVYAAFPKGDKAEHIVQKSVEIGAKAVVFFPSARCVSRPEPKALLKKVERLNKISEEAAKQSRRGQIPQVRAASGFVEAIEAAADAELALFFYEEEKEKSLGEILGEHPGFRTAALVTGSEGGFTPEEADEAKKKGLAISSMGSRILRCETAPLCALSAIMLASGNM